MPISCSESVLTGQDGSVWFTPAGTSHCLLDLTDFPLDSSFMKVPVTHDFKPGDPVIFRPEGGVLDSALTANAIYFIGLTQEKQVQVLASLGGAPVLFNADGGAPASNRGAVLTFGARVNGAGYANGTYANVALSGGSGTGAIADITVSGGGVTACVLDTDPAAGGIKYAVGDVLSAPNSLLGGTGNGFQITVATITPLPTDTPGGHVRVQYAEYAAVAQVASYTLNLTRDQLETTSLPAGVGKGQGKYAAFRTRQAGFADGTGSMVARFTRDQRSLASRLLANSMLRSQDGARVKLYIDTISDGSISNPLPDDVVSSYFEGAISIEGMDLNVTPDGVSEATLNFSLSAAPTRILTVDL